MQQPNNSPRKSVNETITEKLHWIWENYGRDRGALKRFFDDVLKAKEPRNEHE